jgi:large subunit ribosomal protein L34e
MVRRILRTKRKRKVTIKTATQVKIHYRERKHKKVKCGSCKKELQGIPNLIKSKFRALTKSQRNVARKYGGNLCSTCSRKRIIEETGALKLKK